MKVYRYLSEKELKQILSGNIEDIGAYYNREKYKKINTHKYKDGVKYLHFFKNTKLMNQISFLHREDDLTYYICEFDIPLKYLITHVGIGRYDVGGYDNDRVEAVEFAIDASKLNPAWLKSYKKDPVKTMWGKMIP